MRWPSLVLAVCNARLPEALYRRGYTDTAVRHAFQVRTGSSPAACGRGALRPARRPTGRRAGDVRGRIRGIAELAGGRCGSKRAARRLRGAIKLPGRDAIGPGAAADFEPIRAHLRPNPLPAGVPLWRRSAAPPSFRHLVAHLRPSFYRCFLPFPCRALPLSGWCSASMACLRSTRGFRSASFSTRR